MITDQRDVDIKNDNKRNGFTLAELLIVVAIIAVLVAIAIPIFNSQLEKSREAVDLANARSAYAEVMNAAISEDTGATHDGQQIFQGNGVYSITIDPIKQTQNGWQTPAIEEKSIGGVKYAAWRGTPKKGGSCTVSYDSGSGTASVSWNGGFSLLSSVSVSMDGVNWWDNSNERRDALSKLWKTDNSKRLESDKQVISSIADYFNGMSADEAKRILGDKRYNTIVSGNYDELFEYGQDRGGSIRINNLDTSYQPYLSDLGYDARVYSSGKKSTTADNQYGVQKHNYTDKYLLTSNEVLGTSYTNDGKESTKHIKISFSVENGKVSGTKVWVEGVPQLTSGQ